MTVVETLLVFVVAPLAFFAVVTAFVMLPGLRNRDRYKPGRPWGHAPVWYEPTGPGGGGDGQGEHGAHGTHGDDHVEVSTGARASALAIGAAPHPAGSPTGVRTAAGGARGTW